MLSYSGMDNMTDHKELLARAERAVAALAETLARMQAMLAEWQWGRE